MKMPTATLTATLPGREDSSNLSELVRFVHSQTQQQVSNLSIHHREGRLVVTGQSRTYYIKQLVTQAILMSLPAVHLVNDICVL
jgi:hypothetical protein